jgi:hypothetical protein
MLTLDDVLADQRDIEGLCADRSRPNTELFEQNELYGYAAILKRAASLPLHRPLNVVIPHGISLSGAGQWDLQTPCPTVYSYQREHDVALSYDGERVIIRGASPLVHVASEIQPQPRRQGTLFFPAHTIKTVHADAEYEAVADTLLQLPADLQPVRVCVYWADYLKGQHYPFVERGLPVVTAGHMWDPLFPWRLAQLLSMHAVAASNSYGTHTFLALHMGCNWLQIPTPIRYHADPGCEWHHKPSDGAIKETLDLLLDTGAPVSSTVARQIADDLLGVHRTLPAPALASALHAAERRARLIRAA